MSRTESEIKAAVFAALRRIAPDAEPANLQPSEKLREALDIDSYDFLQFLIALKKRPGSRCPGSRLRQTSNVGRAVVLSSVSKQLGDKSVQSGYFLKEEFDDHLHYR